MKLSVPSLLAFAMSSHTVQAADPSDDNRDTGTYEFIICKGACSFSDRGNAFATAVVVLFDGVISRPDQERIEPYHSHDPSEVRACYTIERQAEARSYLGIKKTGITAWTLNGHTIQFDLFRSTDAGYVVEIDRTSGLLTGTGKSWGAGMGAPPVDYGPDTFVGRRLGPPDISACRSTPTPENRPIHAQPQVVMNGIG
jgi:hypothetical protein